jgi:FtsP/CotA-like multicopper oxidase with cupredoxin domain
MKSKPSRREFLALGGSALLAGTALRTTAKGGGDDAAVPRFLVPLPIPEVLDPVKADATTDYYELVQREAAVEILPGRQTTIWGYDGRFPGPTIKARRGRTTVVRHTNQLSVPTVVHLHGGVTPPESDGFPTDHIMPGASRTYTYPNEGRAATLWYHDHVMDHTGRNVYMGLAGLYLLADDGEASLRLPADRYDIPILIQDRLFDAEGAFVYDTFRHLAAKGGTMLVNGAPWPRLDVATRKYRLRMVNGSNATPLRLALSSGQPMIQIATDGGLLPKPVASASIPLAMAERVEVVVDFSRYPIGSQVVLQNLHDTDLSGHVVDEIMRFDVVRSETDDSLLPDRLGELAPLPAEQAVRTRHFVFAGRPRLRSPAGAHWTINGEDFDADRAIAAPRYGDAEIWHIENRRLFGFLGLVHPVHVHLVNFQIIERDGKPPLPHEVGWKDTVAVPKGREVKIIARFEGYRGRYVLHCHNLEHEDHSMMARFDIV